ncbi:hypothetical protein Micbo1qcDRAFT_11950 [Microdochium bolleyi]|uniref:NYN domain-containing protein n=1 Tax=Microdochium bolleyi TaxID=196109 RepID=A0A136IX75_9PEZI|nr:hypothetical protein Micbo1qcDRAFT_11950 [Microdochium bolleyi]
MLNEGLASPHHDIHGLVPTTLQNLASTSRPSSSGATSPLTPRVQSSAPTPISSKSTLPRLGFGLQDIFALDEELETTPTPSKPPAGFQLGAGLRDFFQDADGPVFTPSKREAPPVTPSHPTESPHRTRILTSRHILQSVLATDLTDDDSDSDSDSSTESDFGDDTLVNESKPSTPETSLPFTPSPGDKRVNRILFTDDVATTHGLAGPQLLPATHVIDYEPRALGTGAALEQNTFSTSTTPARDGGIRNNPSISTPERKIAKVIPNAPFGGLFSYASLVASGPSIGDFSRLLASGPGAVSVPISTRSKSTPVLTLREQKWASLEKKLKHHIAVDKQSDADVHIYVDMSNIHIGFIDSWKLAHNVPISQRIKAPKFSFENLARILSRDRPVKEKHLAGSVAFPATRRSNWPKHMKDAAGMGYAMKIMERVLKEKSPPKHHQYKPLGYASIHETVYNFATTSADDSTEDNAPSFVPSRNGEQGVDEGLHVEMLTTIIDHEPGIMVLATGDGAEAEFSQGFKSYATRAMKLGWDIEVCAWKKTVSSAWTESGFLAEWGDQIRIIHLDPFLSELVADTP